MDKNISKLVRDEKGVSLILTFFIMMIILVIVLSISVLLYSQVKVIRNIGNSMISLYAADSGIEKVLYYDRQVRTLTGQACIDDSSCSPGTCNNGFCTILVKRGLCSIFGSVNANTYQNQNACSDISGDNVSGIYCNLRGEPTIYTDPLNSNTGPLKQPHGCDSDICNDCQISFTTTFDSRTYTTVATVTLDADTAKIDPDYTITSKGVYGGAQREIEILIKPIQ